MPRGNTWDPLPAHPPALEGLKHEKNGEQGEHFFGAAPPRGSTCAAPRRAPRGRVTAYERVAGGHTACVQEYKCGAGGQGDSARQCAVANKEYHQQEQEEHLQSCYGNKRSGNHQTAILRVLPKRGFDVAVGSWRRKTQKRNTLLRAGRDIKERRRCDVTYVKAERSWRDTVTTSG